MQVFVPRYNGNRVLKFQTIPIAIILRIIANDCTNQLTNKYLRLILLPNLSMFMKNVYKSLSALILLLVFASSVAMAQRVVTGTVLDEYDVGLPGVSVLVKGTTTGTATDIDGKFSLNVPNDQAVLVFSFIGYAKIEQVVGNRSVVDVKMRPDEQTLTELVVTGYTIDSRRETTGAIATVDPKDLTVIPTGNIEQTLQGRVSGVTVITNGQPGIMVCSV